MSRESQKVQKSTTVRIYEKTKERLQTVARKKAGEENRTVTELELANTAILQFLSQEEQKLGI